MRYSYVGVLLLLYCIPLHCFCQEQQENNTAGTADKLINFPADFFNKMQGKTTALNDRLTRQTEKYLQKIARREARLKKKLYRIDSTAAKKLFSDATQQQYAALAQKLKNDTGSRSMTLSGEYQPYTDSLKTSLAFLQQNPQLLNTAGISTGVPGMTIPPQLQSSVSQLQQLQARLQDADQAKAFISQRRDQIRQYLAQYTNLPNSLTKEYQGYNQDLYYYSQQVRQYKDMLNNPGELEKNALALLNRLPAFQSFMKNNSQLTGLFSLPDNYGSAASLTGLQTRDQVDQLIRGQLSAAGPNAMSALQSNLQSAQQQMGQFKDKLSQLGGGSGDMNMPDFKPNDQKTKTFLKRLEYGTNLQTARTSYYFPVTTDFGLSLGYKLNNDNTVGLGASYKLGWGSGINHISLSSQGAGLRSFIDIKIKTSFSATGGLEYNYVTPLGSLQQIEHISSWSQSGLIGISKTVSVKSKVFKKTKAQLLWDFLSYQQVPRTQPVLFRIGYNF